MLLKRNMATSPNPFDQFDTPVASAAGNPFDQFDAPKQQAISPMPAMDALKRTVGLGVKGFDDSIIRTLLYPADAVSGVINKYGTGPNSPLTATQPLGEQYQNWSDKQTHPATNPAEQVAEIGGGFLGGAKMPLPGGGAAAPSGQLADSFATARQAGYAIPPASVHPTALNRTIETLLGPKELAAEFSQKNVAKASENLVKQFDLPPGTEISHATMDAVRNKAGVAYDAIASLGPQYRDLVEKVKTLRSTASKLYRQNASNYTKATEDEANSTWQEAQAADDILAKALKQQGGGDLVDNYIAARKTIAQTHDVDKAIIDSRAEVKPQTFATAYAKEKPQSGALLDLGRSTQAFGAAFNTKPPARATLTNIDNLLLGSGAGLYGLAHEPKLAGATLLAALARAGGRKFLASNFMQDSFLLSPAQKRAALAESLLRGTFAANSQE